MLAMREEAQTDIENAGETRSLEQLLSSPLITGSKPKKKPTVTPRTFTRFFTPRSSLGKRRQNTWSRQALRDITTPATNRNADSSGRETSHLEPFPDITPYGDDNGWSERTFDIKRRRILTSPDSTVAGSSPIKQSRQASPIVLEAVNLDDEHRATIPEPEETIGDTRTGRNVDAETKPRIRRRLQPGSSGRIFERSLRNTKSSREVDHCGCWQSETTNFYSRPEDSHLCINPENQDRALPFCTASCNTNTLVAIGDEEGGVRLLESVQDGKPSFSTAYLTFRPHNNAVLDLAFSSNDMLLATASGDQSGQVIDMPTQRTIFTMAGHGSSVKQVRFQPGSGDKVIATSSRDGSIQIWDLRCKYFDGPIHDMRVSLEASSCQSAANQTALPECMAWLRSVNSIHGAHATRVSALSSVAMKLSSLGSAAADAPSSTESLGRQGVVSVTALAFLPPGREHLLLTTSEANASVKLWDLRTTHNHRRGRAKPLSYTRQPQSHDRHRQFGLTSLSLSGDGARFYTVCRDSSIYTYSTNHMVLGHAPELSAAASRPRRSGGLEKEGLGPIYGFRHPRFHATTFYVKSSLRQAFGDRSEMLSVGSSDGNAVLFPTDERYMKGQDDTFGGSHMDPPALPRSGRPSLSRTGSAVGLSARLEDAIPIYQHGTALVRGHSKEVTALTWTSEGSLVTVGDDFTARCWREGPDARDLRVGGEKAGRRWGCGWAEVQEGWDDDDD